jgi:hypothetical protein
MRLWSREIEHLSRFSEILWSADLAWRGDRVERADRRMRDRRIYLFVFLSWLAWPCGLLAGLPRPPYLDFGSVPPARAGDSFELDLEGPAFSVATLALSSEERALVEAVERVQIRVVDVDSTNESEVRRRYHEAEKQLNASGWKRVATPPCAKNQATRMFARPVSHHTSGALAILIWDRGTQVVVGYAAGAFSEAQVTGIARHMRIDSLRDRFSR